MENLDLAAALLRSVGLNPPLDEVNEISGFYTSLREQVDRLYDIDVREFGPGPVFDAREARP